MGLYFKGLQCCGYNRASLIGHFSLAQLDEHIIAQKYSDLFLPTMDSFGAHSDSHNLFILKYPYYYVSAVPLFEFVIV